MVIVVLLYNNALYCIIMHNEDSHNYSSVNSSTKRKNNILIYMDGFLKIICISLYFYVPRRAPDIGVTGIFNDAHIYV